MKRTSRVTVTTGFILVDAAGATVDHFDCPVDACWAMNKRHYPGNAVHAVKRLADGVVIATRHTFEGDSFYMGAWRLVARGAIV